MTTTIDLPKEGKRKLNREEKAEKEKKKKKKKGKDTIDYDWLKGEKVEKTKKKKKKENPTAGFWGYIYIYI